MPTTWQSLAYASVNASKVNEVVLAGPPARIDSGRVAPYSAVV